MFASDSLPNLAGRTVDDGTLLLKKVVGAGGSAKLYRAVDTESARSSRRSSWASTNSSSSSTTTAPSSISTPGVYAVKCLHNDPFYDRERLAHRRVSRHPNIVTLHREFTTEEHLFIVMDFHASGDMSAALSEGLYHRNTPFVKQIFAQIADAVLFCHSQGIFHRDIKPANILVDHDGGNSCLTDFGVATHNAVTSSQETGSYGFMCPESFEEGFQGPYSAASCDAWALGITLINLVTTQAPWCSARLSDQRFKTYCAAREQFLRTYHPVSRPFAALLSRFLCVDVEERIPLAQFVGEVAEMNELYMSERDLRRASVVLRDLAAWTVPGRPTVADSTASSESGVEDDKDEEVASAAAENSAAVPVVAKPGKFKRVMRRLRLWRK